jgi:hypothetical protein
MLVGASAHADIVYEDPQGQGTQDYGGNLALTFNVLSPVDVTALGVFDGNGTSAIASGGEVHVVIFNTSTDVQVTPVVTFMGGESLYTPAGLGFDVFQQINPVLLGAGSYSVDEVGLALNGNLNTGSSSGPILNSLGGALSFTGAAYDGNGLLDDPLTCPGCKLGALQFSQFDAGTFEAVPASSSVTPEPNLFAVGGLLFALLMFNAIRRNRSLADRPKN